MSLGGCCGGHCRNSGYKGYCYTPFDPRMTEVRALFAFLPSGQACSLWVLDSTKAAHRPTPGCSSTPGSCTRVMGRWRGRWTGGLVERLPCCEHCSRLFMVMRFEQRPKEQGCKFKRNWKDVLLKGGWVGLATAQRARTSDESTLALKKTGMVETFDRYVFPMSNWVSLKRLYIPSGLGMSLGLPWGALL